MLARMRLHLTLAACLFSGLLSCHGEDAAPAGSGELVIVGGRAIRLPAPGGFERIDGLNIDDDRAVAAMLPATNRYLARYNPPKAQTAADQGRSFNAQVLRDVESREIGNRTFSQMKQQTKSEIDKAQETLREELAKVTGKDAKNLPNSTVADALSVSEVAVLGLFNETPSSLGFTMAMNVAKKADDPTNKTKAVIASMIVPVNGRLIYLYANADFKSEADRKWAEQAVTMWRDAVLAVNPRVEGPDVSSSIFDGVGSSTVIAGIVGGLAAVIVLLFKRKKA
ncbi:MAG: hypothetical protein JWR15_1610 [Prosthecobacter sp.]|nr:hypothetical protein [Prosthecobacter sp.]